MEADTGTPVMSVADQNVSFVTRLRCVMRGVHLWKFAKALCFRFIFSHSVVIWPHNFAARYNRTFVGMLGENIKLFQQWRP